MKKRRMFILLGALLGVLVLAFAISPQAAVAGSSSWSNGTTTLTLDAPNSQQTCTPDNTVTVSIAGLPAGYYVQLTVTIEMTAPEVYTFDSDGTHSVSVTYPHPSTWPVTDTGVSIIHGTAHVAYYDQNGNQVEVPNDNGTSKPVELQEQWNVKCDSPPPPPPPPPPPTGDDGCTPGYWRQPHHFDSWVGFNTTDDFEMVFDVDASFDPNSLLDAVWLRGGGENAMARHAVAALLNAANPDVEYAYTVDQVTAAVQDAYASDNFEAAKDNFEAANESFCPLD